MASITSQEFPFNKYNKLMGEEEILKVLSKYCDVENFVIKNKGIYRTSMVHKSYCTRKNENFEVGNVNCPEDCIPIQEESNERLEFLGDAVINLIVGKYLYDRYPDNNEGFLTKMRTKLVNGKMLAELCTYTGLQEFMIISKQIEENNGRNNKKLLEDMFEAFVGAVFIDTNDYKFVEVWLINLIEDNIDFSELILTNNNHKDIFIKKYQQMYNYFPNFVEISCQKGMNNNKIYKICIKNKDTVVSYGVGETKKMAENEAAKKALEALFNN